MNILSLFDGMSCGQQAITNLGIKDYTYFASEIDKYAIQVTQENFPNTIQIGDIEKIVIARYGSLCYNPKELPITTCYDSEKIDLLLGGSPCQGFSFAGKQLNFQDPRSALFFEYVRILKEVKPKYFLLENVKMKKEYQDIISEYLFGIQPTIINSSLLTAQNRVRLYWVGELQEDGTYKQVEIEQPKDKGILLKDILEDKVDDKYYITSKVWEKLQAYESNSRLSPLDGKSYCLNTMQGGHRQPKILTNINPSGKGMNGNVYNTEKKSPTLTTNKGEGPKILNRPHGYFKGSIHTEKCPTIRSQVEGNILKQEENRIRKITPIECERLQGVKDNYTSSVSNSQRYKMLGNGWTIPVIEHILKHIV